MRERRTRLTCALVAGRQGEDAEGYREKEDDRTWLRIERGGPGQEEAGEGTREDAVSGSGWEEITGLGTHGWLVPIGVYTERRKRGRAGAASEDGKKKVKPLL